MKQKVTIIGHVDHGHSTLHHAIAHKLADMGVELATITLEEAERERGITINDVSSHPNYQMAERIQQIIAEKQEVMKLKPLGLPPTYFKPPLTRRERRAQARKEH